VVSQWNIRINRCIATLVSWQDLGWF